MDSNRKQTILDACSRLQGLMDQRAEINEDIKSLKNTLIKGELGFKISDFNAAFRIWQLDREPRDEMLDTLRECFEALGVGGQLDWLAAADDGDTDGDTDTDTKVTLMRGSKARTTTANAYPTA